MVRTVVKAEKQHVIKRTLTIVKMPDKQTAKQTNIQTSKQTKQQTNKNTQRPLDENHHSCVFVLDMMHARCTNTAASNKIYRALIFDWEHARLLGELQFA